MNAFTTTPIEPQISDGHPLLKVSHLYGSDPSFVLGGGGNTSFKLGDKLWIKASGHSLATIESDGFVSLDRQALEQMLQDEWPTDPQQREVRFVQQLMAARIAPSLGQRPSVESLLHHLIPDPLVVHTHPGAVNALTCSTKGREIAEDLFGDLVLWQPYVDPGLVLATSLQSALGEYQETHEGRGPLGILLQNHGLIVGGDNAQSIAAATDRLVLAVRERLSDAPLPSFTANEDAHRLLKTHAAAATGVHRDLFVSTDSSEAVRWLASTPAGRSAAMNGPLTPDQIVYCRSVPLWIDSPAPDLIAARTQWTSARARYEQEHGVAPWVAVIAGAGIISMRENTRLAEVCCAVYADAARVYRDAHRLGGVHPLNQRDRKFIEDWEVEAHRRAVMSQSAEEE